jgi:hypothetical protein
MDTDENTNDVNSDDQDEDTLANAVDEDNDEESNGGTASSIQPEPGIPNENLEGSSSDATIPSPDNMS